MSGKRFILDTNAIVSLFQGNQPLAVSLSTATWIGISVISQIEFLVFDGLTEEDLRQFNCFTQRVDIVNLTGENHDYLSQIIAVRKKNHLKLPDAIIAATAIQTQSILVTADKAFQRIEELTILNPLELTIE